jgi:hypothetical protein
MFIPAPVSKAAPALKKELTNGHCDGVTDEAVFGQRQLASREPQATEGNQPRYCDVIASRPERALSLLSRPRYDERREL